MKDEFPILTWRRIIIDGEQTPYIISDKGIVKSLNIPEYLRDYFKIIISEIIESS